MTLSGRRSRSGCFLVPVCSFRSAAFARYLGFGPYSTKSLDNISRRRVRLARYCTAVAICEMNERLNDKRAGAVSCPY